MVAAIDALGYYHAPDKNILFPSSISELDTFSDNDKRSYI